MQGASLGDEGGLVHLLLEGAGLDAHTCCAAPDSCSHVHKDPESCLVQLPGERQILSIMISGSGLERSAQEQQIDFESWVL